MNITKFLFIIFLFVSLLSLGRMCRWLPVWHLCQNATLTRRRPALSSILLCLEDKTLLLPSGGAIRITHRYKKKYTVEVISFLLIIVPYLPPPLFHSNSVQCKIQNCTVSNKIKLKGQVMLLQCSCTLNKFNTQS